MILNKELPESDYKVVVFDLDDTLINTSHLLIPQAVRSACQELINSGLQCSLDECIQMRNELIQNLSHSEIFELMTQKWPCPEPAISAQKAINMFYAPPIPNTLPLLEGAKQNLETLKTKYHLYLVTSGLIETQTQKIKACGIAPFFQEVLVIDNLKGRKKKEAFLNILQKENCKPAQLLSIGNRLSSEIRDAKTCGARTCYFAFGEHLGETPQQPEDIPDYTITSHYELIKTCKL